MNLISEVGRWCAEILERSPTAIAIAKRSFNADSDNIRGIAAMGMQTLNSLLPDRRIARRRARLQREAQTGFPALREIARRGSAGGCSAPGGIGREHSIQRRPAGISDGRGTLLAREACAALSGARAGGDDRSRAGTGDGLARPDRHGDLPEHHGGLGLPSETTGIIIEALAYGDCQCRLCAAARLAMRSDHCRATPPKISPHDGCRALSPAKALVALALTEPRGGSDAANLVLSARPTDTGYVLNGEKSSISIADQADAVAGIRPHRARRRRLHAASALFWCR